MEADTQPRQFTTAYKLWILEEIEENPEEEPAILLRESLTPDHIKYWRRQKARGEFDGLIAHRGRSLVKRNSAYPAKWQAPPDRSFSFNLPTFLDPALRIDQSMQLRDLFETIWRGKWTIVSTVTVLTMLTFTVLLRLTPVYSGEALIMLESAQSVEGIDAERRLEDDPQMLETEMEVMRSRHLANKVVDQLKLAAVEEFNPTLQPTSAISRLATFVNSLRKPPGSVSSEALSETDRLAKNQAMIINELLEHTQLSQRGKSRVISLEVKSKDSILAAQIANALAEGYIADQLEAKFRRIRRTNNWLKERIAVLRQKVSEAETEVENFRNRSGLIGLLRQSGEPNAQEMSQLNAELANARARRSEAEARLREAKKSAETLDSPLIHTLKERAAELDREIAERSTEYGPAHPIIVNLQAQKKDVLDKIASEISRNLTRLENEVRVVHSRETDLVAQLKTARGRLANASQADVELRALEREAAASRELLESFMERYQVTSSYLDTQTPNARIISKADVPPGPSFPKPIPILALSLFGSTLLGVMLALTKEFFKRGFNSSEHIERATGLPVLASVPKLGFLTKFRTEPESYAVKHQNSAFGEAIRRLITGVRLVHKGQPPRRLLVTSSLPREGKTVIATALAQSLSMGGRKTVLIKADLRKQKAKKVHANPDLLGLGEYLAGKAKVGEVIHTDPLSGAHVIPRGKLELTRLPELLDGKLMNNLLKELIDIYDFVVVDAPPMMAVSDVLILENTVDMVLFVVHWAKTPQDVVSRMLELLSSGEAPVGIALSMVDKEQV